MTGWQLHAAAMLYAWAAFDYYRVDRYAMCAAFVCYAVANIAYGLESRN